MSIIHGQTHTGQAHILRQMRGMSESERLSHERKITSWYYAMAREDQKPPKGDWLIWLLLGGRGAGKTRAGAEWILEQVKHGSKRIALVGPSYNEVRAVMIDGESGLLNIGDPKERPTYYSSRKLLQWKDGAAAQIFSAEDPDGLRGPQFECAWADEFCAWSYPSETLSNLRFGLRLGDKPRLVMTTTPRPIAALKKLMQDNSISITRAATMDNKENLSGAFMKAITESYGGTRLGRQELLGEILDDHQGALWSRDMIEAARVKEHPCLDKIIIAVDPPVTSGVRSDACGVIIAGRAGFGGAARAYILHDGSVERYSPNQWAAHVLSLWETWDADYIVAEVNQGGDLVKTIFNTHGKGALVRTVYASRSKTARAEPVAALYEQGKVKHVGGFSKLEDEMCLMGADIKSPKSPDRADALVWAVTELLSKPRKDPHIRQL